jgi:hypothetical protein
MKFPAPGPARPSLRKQRRARRVLRLGTPLFLLALVLAVAANVAFPSLAGPSWAIAGSLATVVTLGSLAIWTLWLVREEGRPAYPVAAAFGAYVAVFLLSPPPAIVAAAAGQSQTAGSTLRLVLFALHLLLALYRTRRRL